MVELARALKLRRLALLPRLCLRGLGRGQQRRGVTPVPPKTPPGTPKEGQLARVWKLCRMSLLPHPCLQLLGGAARRLNTCVSVVFCRGRVHPALVSRRCSSAKAFATQSPHRLPPRTAQAQGARGQPPGARSRCQVTSRPLNIGSILRPCCPTHEHVGCPRTRGNKRARKGAIVVVRRGGEHNCQDCGAAGPMRILTRGAG